ncbi:MAG: hypothetical protein AAGG11_18645 [Pseudomonadota bacterium]
MSTELLFATPPQQLGSARLLSHAAVQWPSRAARANLQPLADDSHSNLGWHDDSQALVSHPLDRDGRYQLAFSFTSAALLWLTEGTVAATLLLADADETSAGAWCDALLAEAGLRATGVAEVPYELAPVDYAGFAAAGAALETLGAWYAQGQVVLQTLVGAFGPRAVVLPTVRCWPHHYDLGTLFALDASDPETARSIGVGLSPGDGSYAEPYFYCTPWPTPARLPAAPETLHWHTQGFTSLVLPASRVGRRTELPALLTAAVELAHRTL